MLIDRTRIHANQLRAGVEQDPLLTFFPGWNRRGKLPDVQSFDERPSPNALSVNQLSYDYARASTR